MLVNMCIVITSLAAFAWGGWLWAVVMFVLGMVLGTFMNLYGMGVTPISAAQNLWAYLLNKPLPCDEAVISHFDSQIEEKWERLENAGFDPNVGDAINVVNQTLKDMEENPGKFLNMRKEKK
jgi:hypothetical protein